MNGFVNALSAAASPMAVTENGALARSTTGSAVLDLFSQIGGMRDNIDRLPSMLDNAMAEDLQLTTRLMFYSRDVRGGQGERNIFRVGMNHLMGKASSVTETLAFVPEYGRWDDLFAFIDIAEDKVINIIRAQLMIDIVSERPSLLAKWMPSENTSSKATRTLASRVRSALGYTPKAYRKMLTDLRKRLDVVEVRMSAGDFEGIDFSRVPSQAMSKYRTAFFTRQNERMCEFLKKVESGEEKINAATLFPYQLVSGYIGYGVNKIDPVVEAQWKALPDYFEGKVENSLVVADVSGSMTGLPMETAISLAIYIAERNKGIWHNKFMTFSMSPQIQNLVGDSLHERVSNLSGADWGMNTDLEKTFNKILSAAVASNLAPADMIKRLYIISDMEFDAATQGRSDVTLLQNIRQKFINAGYELPEIVFWNVRASNKQFPMAMDERGFLNVSGSSPSIFKYTLNKTFVSPYELMTSVLNSPRYEALKII